MIELGQLAPQILVALVIVAAAVLLMWQMRKISGNGKLAEVATRLDAMDKQLVGLQVDVAHIKGKLDAAAENTGRHAALVEGGSK